MEARRLVRRSLETRKKELLAAWTRVAVMKERHPGCRLSVGGPVQGSYKWSGSGELRKGSNQR